MEQRQPSPDGQRRLAAAKIIEPDQAEAKRGFRLIGIFSGPDHRQAGGSLSEKCARERRGKAVVQVRFRAQFDEPPLWKLASQGSAKAFTVL